jgi:hypothetical protein
VIGVIDHNYTRASEKLVPKPGVLN